MLTITILSWCRNEGKPVPVYTHVAEPKVHVQRVAKTARQVIIAGLNTATLRIGKHANRGMDQPTKFAHDKQTSDSTVLARNHPA